VAGSDIHAYTSTKSGGRIGDDGQQLRRQHSSVHISGGRVAEKENDDDDGDDDEEEEEEEEEIMKKMKKMCG